MAQKARACQLQESGEDHQAQRFEWSTKAEQCRKACVWRLSSGKTNQGSTPATLG